MLVRRYPDAQAALHAYEMARDLLVTADLDASVLRVTVKGTSFVAALGEVPLGSEVAQQMHAALGNGLAAALPGPVAIELRRRRLAFNGTGLGYMERRTGR